MLQLPTVLLFPTVLHLLAVFHIPIALYLPTVLQLPIVELPLTVLVVVCVIIYNAAFGMSWGPVPWLYPPEIMPLPFRAKGVSLSTATNWLFVSGSVSLNDTLLTSPRTTGSGCRLRSSKSSSDGGSTSCTRSFAAFRSSWVSCPVSEVCAIVLELTL